jgi:hypothetical protein
MQSPGVAALTIDSGGGYVLEGTKFGVSTYQSEAIHVNAPIQSGAPHLAIGIQTSPGGTVSDDPSIQVIAPSLN